MDACASTKRPRIVPQVAGRWGFIPVSLAARARSSALFGRKPAVRGAAEPLQAVTGQRIFEANAASLNRAFDRIVPDALRPRHVARRVSQRKRAPVRRFAERRSRCALVVGGSRAVATRVVARRAGAGARAEIGKAARDRTVHRAFGAGACETTLRNSGSSATSTVRICRAPEP